MDIKARETSIQDLFHGINTQYQVPHYQRDYAWAAENVEELWTDITNSWATDSKYFMGAILLNNESCLASNYEIVDGQQRLATFTILLATIRDFAKTYQDNPSKEYFEKVDKSNTVNSDKAARAYRMASNLVVHLSEPDNYYLKLNDKDQNTFFERIQKESEVLDFSSRRIIRNEKKVIKTKKILTKHIQDDIVDYEDGLIRLDKFLTYCIQKLVILRIDVSTDSDAYLLFETLNDRGADLSIADLVKNRLLLNCAGNNDKKDRVLRKWDQIVETLSKSRYKTHDFLRFFWIAFHNVNTTKREVYDRIKKYLSGGVDVEDLVNSWFDASQYFADITDKDLLYPAGTRAYTPGGEDQYYSEINTLGYSVCYPLLLAAYKKDKTLIASLLPTIVSYLFRVISIGGFAAGRAESVFIDALNRLNANNSATQILASFSDREASNEKLKARIIDNPFEDNKTARYFLAKLHQQSLGTGLRITKSVHLEHILPIENSKWKDFNPLGRPFDDWKYAIGNMTLLEKELNSAIKNDIFEEKIKFYKKRTTEPEDDQNTTSIPMTYKIYDSLIDNPKWDANCIQTRTREFAELACSVWPEVYIEPITQI